MDKAPAEQGQNPTGSSPEPQNGHGEASRPSPAHRWTFLSNHAHVLICLAKDPHMRMRDVAERIGITERAVMKIVADLEGEGLLERHREGRRNAYDLHLDQPLRHPIEEHRTVGELVQLILDDDPAGSQGG